MKFFGYIINTAFTVLMLGIVGLFMLPYLPFDHGIEMRIVESGSMEPAVMTGSLILVQPAQTYAIGDIIMFESRSANVPTTHRIVETYEDEEATWFVTKGDANEEADARVVPMREVMGAVAFDIPRAGFVLDFARQPVGFVFLIVLPAFLIILTELEKIWREVRGRREKASDDGDGGDAGTPQTEPQMESMATHTYQPMMDIGTPVRYFVLPTLDLRRMHPYRRRDTRRIAFPRGAAVCSIVGFSLLIVSANFLGSTVSYFNDTEESTANTFSAVTLDFVANADGSVYTFTDGELDDEDGGAAIAITPEPESVEMLHDVSVEVMSGSTVLCDAVVADSTDPFVYSGVLPLMSASDVAFEVSWKLDFSLGDTSLLSGGESCTADIVFTAWHFDASSGDGYFDEERVPLTFNYALPASAFAPSVAGASVSVRSVAGSSDDGTSADVKEENEQGSGMSGEKKPDAPLGESGNAQGQEKSKKQAGSEQKNESGNDGKEENEDMTAQEDANGEGEESNAGDEQDTVEEGDEEVSDGGAEKAQEEIEEETTKEEKDKEQESMPEPETEEESEPEPEPRSEQTADESNEAGGGGTE